MTEQPSATPDSVYFDLRDYAHPIKRVLACAIDIVLLLAVFSIAGTLVGVFLMPQELRGKPRTAEVQRQMTKYMKPAQRPLGLGWLAFCIVYQIPLRRTRGGTIGHRLMRTRLVDKNGNTPPIRAVFRRFLIAAPATLFLGLSYWDSFRNPRRQATHDIWSGTWVVRCRAKPAGPAITSHNPKLLGTILLTYVDVEPVLPQASISSTAAAKEPADPPACVTPG